MIYKANAIGQPPPLPGNQTMAPVAIVEPVGGYWTSESQWGNRFQGDFPGQVGDIVPVLNMIQFPGPPREIGISLFRTDSPAQKGAPLAARGPENAEVYCQIIYGAGGVANTLLLDWASGAQFSIPCSSMRINAVAYQPRFLSFGPVPPATKYNNRQGIIFPPPAAVPPVAQLTLAAIVGLDGVARPIPPSFTTQNITLAAGQSTFWAAPEYSVKVIPMFTYATGGIIPIVYSDFVISTADSFGNPYQAFVMNEEIATEGIHLPGRGQMNVFVSNVAGVASWHVALKFLLSL